MPGLIDSNASLGIYGQNANMAGGNQAVPTAASNNTPAIGGASNPLLPQFPGGTSTPDISSSINTALPINGGTSSASASNPSNFDVAALAGGGGLNAGQNGKPSEAWTKLVNSFKASGIDSGQASLMANFLASGAGFNPEVANVLIAAMQPQINRGAADIMEWMGSKGLSNSSSPAALALGDYYSQVQLNEGQIFAGLYEQSVQNYMNVLTGPRKTGNVDFMDRFLQTLQVVSGFTPKG